MKKIQKYLIVALSFLAIHSLCEAKKFTVSNTSDAGLASLRQAVADANSRKGKDTIIFAGATDGKPIVLTSGTLGITDALFVKGNGKAKTLIQGGADIFTISPNLDAKFVGIAFSNFSISAITRPDAYGTSGNLDVLNCSFTGPGAVTGIRYINHDGTITVDSCNFSNIQYGASVYCMNARFTNNYATKCDGGAGLDIKQRGQPGNVVVKNNTAENSTYGFLIEIKGSGEISNNTAYKNTHAGMHISLLSDANPPTGLITNNTCAFNGRGMSIDNSSGSVPNIFSKTVIQNCILSNNSQFDFMLEDYEEGTNPTFINNIGVSISKNGMPLTVGFFAADPKLNPSGTAYEGGFTPTISIAYDSPAIDAGTSANAPDKDQRGRSRYGKVDIGAYELRAALKEGECVSGTGQTLLDSPNGQYYLYINAAGNVIVMDGAGKTISSSLKQWATPLNKGINKMCLSGGKLSLMKNSTEIWNSGTSGTGYRFVISTTGILQIVDGAGKVVK